MAYYVSLVLQVFTILDCWLVFKPYLDLCLYSSLSPATSFEQTTSRTLFSHVSLIQSQVELFSPTFYCEKDRTVTWLASLRISHQVKPLEHASFLSTYILGLSYRECPHQCDGLVSLTFYISKTYDATFALNSFFLEGSHFGQVFLYRCLLLLFNLPYRCRSSVW